MNKLRHSPSSMNKNTRLALIASIVQKTKAKRRKTVEQELLNRDSGLVMAPTAEDVGDELERMSGFKQDIRQRASDDELLYGSSSLGDETNDGE